MAAADSQQKEHMSCNQNCEQGRRCDCYESSTEPPKYASIKSPPTPAVRSHDLRFEDTTNRQQELLKDLGLTARNSLAAVGMVTASIILGLCAGGWSS